MGPGEVNVIGISGNLYAFNAGANERGHQSALENA